MYMQVDVPMERMPIANWVLIGFTVFCGLFSIAAVDRASRGRDNFPEYQPDPALIQQLNNPQLTDEQRDEIIRQAEEKWEREQGQHRTRSESALYRYALFPDREHFHLWQLVTYQFMHAGLMHLFGNMLFLFCFGNAVNAKLGHLLYLGL